MLADFLELMSQGASTRCALQEEEVDVRWASLVFEWVDD